MKLIPSFKNRRPTLVIGGVFLVLVTPALAQFGLSIVYDPSEVAQTINILQQAIKIATTTQQTLNTVQANLKSFSFKSLWQTLPAKLQAASVHNTYGETAGWDTALNTNSPGAATTAWNLASLQVTPGTDLSGQTAGNSAGLSALAMIEAFDSSSPGCINAVGQYRSLTTANADAETSLDNDQLDTGADTNSEIEQLNLLNAGNQQQMHELQSQGALHACLVEQTTIANMQQRNAAAVAINDAAFVQQQRATNNVNPANESDTWQTYLP